MYTSHKAIFNVNRGGGYSVNQVCEQSDLGVLFTSNFKLGAHIHHIVRQLIGLLALLKSCLNYLAMLRTLYTSLVRPHLDYACVVWCPFKLGDIRTIENVQRHATKNVPLLKDMPYYDHLFSLNLPSLLYRRRRMDMIMVYLIVRGLESTSFDRLFTYCDLSTRSNGYKLKGSPTVAKSRTLLLKSYLKSVKSLDF